MFNGPGSLIYICEQTAPRTCKSWDYLADEWSDPPEPSSPSADHNNKDPFAGNPTAAICTLPDGKVVMSGGFNDVNDIMHMGGSWTTTAPLFSATKHHACAALSSSRIMIIGGHDGAVELATAYIFDVDLNTRTQVLSMSSPRIGAAAGAITTYDGRQRVIVAGHAFSDEVTFYNVALNT